MQISEEDKGPSLGKCQVKVPHQRSPYALKFEDRSQEEIKNTKAQSNGQSYFLLTYQRMVSPSAIRNTTGRKRIRCRFWSINAHFEHWRPELCRIWNREGLWESDDGCSSQRRSAYKRRSDGVCQRIGFIRDGKASRRYLSCSLTRKTLPRSRIFLWVDQWPETTSHQIWHTNQVPHDELRADRCPWCIEDLLKLIYICISQISIAGSRASRINKKWEFE